MTTWLNNATVLVIKATKKLTEIHPITIKIDRKGDAKIKYNGEIIDVYKTGDGAWGVSADNLG